tara:strand:+ start:512 stop:862 length:351 start_codon:yes stop_codon:yes gene_type:complete
MAQYEDITIDQGADASVELHLVDTDGTVKNLTNHTVTAKLKKTYSSDSSDTTSFVTTVADATRGICTITLTNAQTDALKAGRYVYDVELSFADSDGDTIIERILEGKITVTPSVTR